jgi:hypothetical protein
MAEGEAGSKRCNVCGELKALTEFYAAPGCTDGQRGDCRTCFQAKAVARAEADPDRRRAARDRARQWLLDYPERKRTNNQAYAATGRKGPADRKSHLKRRFGLTPEDYDRMLDEQGGGCAICGDAPGATALHVDHDHDTGVVRGLLCFRCNSALGNLRDDPDTIGAALAYVTRHGRGSR